MKGLRACFTETDIPICVLHASGNDAKGIVGLVVISTIEAHWLDNFVIENVSELLACDVL